MKQTITFTRTETITVEVDAAQALGKATLEGLINRARPFGEPSGFVTTSHRLEPWSAKRIEPQCECQGEGESESVTKRRRRK